MRANPHISRLTLYNEERRLGVQRGSDTLVVPLVTSNDGLSIANILLRILYYTCIVRSLRTACKTLNLLNLIILYIQWL